MSAVFTSSLGASIAGNGTGSAVAVPRPAKYGLIVRGTGLGGGTLTIEVSDDGTNWVSSGVTPAINSYNTLDLGAKYVRYNLTGATGPSIAAIVLSAAS